MKKIDTEIRQTTLTSLAIVGFIALVVAGMWLAVYSTRFVPTVVNRAGSAVVYLGSILIPQHKPNLSVISSSTASTTIFFGNASSTTSKTTTSTHIASSLNPVKTTAGTKTSNTSQISGNASAPVLSGLSDLVVQINAVGYLQSASADSFFASSTVSVGGRPAVSFTIKNIGTNATGSWRFSASIPTQTAYIYQSQIQQSLNPGDSIDYVLGFDQANKGANETISITANFDHAAAESNTNNNSASAGLTILGS